MWLVAILAMLVLLSPLWLTLVGLTQCFGPGPWRCFLWSPLRSSRARMPWRESRLARRVLYRVHEVRHLPWSLQRWLYWRVRRYPDRAFRASAVMTIFGMIVAGAAAGALVWGCGSPAVRVLVPENLPRAYESTWVGLASMLPFMAVTALPLWIAVLAGVSIQREYARIAIRRYAATRPKACDRCRYPLDVAMAKGHVLRCPECGLRHDLRVHASAAAKGPGNAELAEDGPLLVPPRRAARLARGIPWLRDEPPDRVARLIERALLQERYSIMIGRTLYALLCLALAAAIVRVMWPLIDATIGDYHRADITGSHTLSLALALIGPGIGVWLWFWLQGRMVRRVVRRATARRLEACQSIAGG